MNANCLFKARAVIIREKFAASAKVTQYFDDASVTNRKGREKHLR